MELDKQPIMRTIGITKVFNGIPALQDVNLEIYPGEIHAVCGENGAGKSTLMNVLTGSLTPESGEIFFQGKKVSFFGPKDAQDLGISIVHQELSLCAHLSVAENIFIGRTPVKSASIVDKKKMNEMARELLKKLNTDIDPETIAGGLSVSQQQMVEIAKAISINCKVLILDEPTSALTDTEAQNLFKNLMILKENGIAMLYISHRMNEIFQICQRCSILRDGKYIWTKMISDITVDDIIASMVGRKIENAYPEKGNVGKNLKLEVKNLSHKGVYSKISFKLHEGEILGIFGLMGAGRTEVARGICGIDMVDTGEVKLLNEEMPLNNVRKSIDRGLVYISEDRKTQGLFLQMSIKANTIAADLRLVSKNNFIKGNMERELSEKYVSAMNTKCRDINQPIGSLSGGNQQKVLLSKWLAVKPKVIFLDEPTRGIDVGAKYEIHQILRDLSNKGHGVVVISSELPEVIGVSDRILVMYQGEIVGDLPAIGATEEIVMQYASGRKRNIS